MLSSWNVFLTLSWNFKDYYFLLCCHHDTHFLNDKTFRFGKIPNIVIEDVDDINQSKPTTQAIDQSKQTTQAIDQSKQTGSIDDVISNQSNTCKLNR